MISIENATDQTNRVMQLAERSAKRWGHELICTTDILLGLYEEEAGVAQAVLKNSGLNKTLLCSRIADVRTPASTEGSELTISSVVLIEKAQEVMESLGHKKLGTEHLLYAILENTCFSAHIVVVKCSVDIHKMKDHLLSLINPTPEDTDLKEAVGEMLEAREKVETLTRQLSTAQSVLEASLDKIRAVHKRLSR